MQKKLPKGSFFVRILNLSLPLGEMSRSDREGRLSLTNKPNLSLPLGEMSRSDREG